MEIQDSNHQFLECDIAKRYWKLAKKIIYSITKHDITIDPATILFNNIKADNTTDRRFITEVILSTKYAIYKNSIDIQYPDK